MSPFPRVNVPSTSPPPALRSGATCDQLAGQSASPGPPPRRAKSKFLTVQPFGVLIGRAPSRRDDTQSC
eukprot:3438181-Pyramimonas_sp.AAC.1